MLVEHALSAHTNAEVMLLPPPWVNSKEEEKRQQQQPHQILASHAVRTSRARVKLHRYPRRGGRQQLYRHQLQRQAKTIRIGFEELAQKSAQLRMHRTILESLAQMNQKLSDGQIL